jgi:hypothetical protein
VRNLSPSIATDRHLLPATGKDQSPPFATDQKDLGIHRKDRSPSIAVDRDIPGHMSNVHA